MPRFRRKTGAPRNGGRGLCRDFEALDGAATWSLDGWNYIDQRDRLVHTVPESASQSNSQLYAVGFRQDVVFGAFLAQICRL